VPTKNAIFFFGLDPEVVFGFPVLGFAGSNVMDYLCQEMVKN